MTPSSPAVAPTLEDQISVNDLVSAVLTLPQWEWLRPSAYRGQDEEYANQVRKNAAAITADAVDACPLDDRSVEFYFENEAEIDEAIITDIIDRRQNAIRVVADRDTKTEHTDDNEIDISNKKAFYDSIGFKHNTHTPQEVIDILEDKGFVAETPKHHSIPYKHKEFGITIIICTQNKKRLIKNINVFVNGQPLR